MASFQRYVQQDGIPLAPDADKPTPYQSPASPPPSRADPRYAPGPSGALVEARVDETMRITRESSGAPTSAAGVKNTDDGGEHLNRTFLLWETEDISILV